MTLERVQEIMAKADKDQNGYGTISQPPKSTWTPSPTMGPARIGQNSRAIEVSDKRRTARLGDALVQRQEKGPAAHLDVEHAVRSRT